jgi:hypothetical protein
MKSNPNPANQSHKLDSIETLLLTLRADRTAWEEHIAKRAAYAAKHSAAEHSADAGISAKAGEFMCPAAEPYPQR